MKNIQIIDGAENCTFSIFAMSDNDFDVLFPDGNDIEFVKDLQKRLGEKTATEILNRLWKHPLDKKSINGIHATIFFQQDFRKKFYPTKKEAEMVANP